MESRHKLAGSAGGDGGLCMLGAVPCADPSPRGLLLRGAQSAETFNNLLALAQAWHPSVLEDEAGGSPTRILIPDT